MLVRQSVANSIHSEGLSVHVKCKYVLVLAAISLFAGIVYCQDSPSLGDVARQQRQQKEKSKAAQGKDAKASKVITNEEIDANAGVAPAPVAAGEDRPASTSASNNSSNEVKPSAEAWTSQIRSQKSQVVSLQKQIEQIKASIKFAPANCVESCVQWNERQREKLRQAEGMQAQLEEQRKRLEAMQDSARKQGYGSAVYDP
jgi:hypothetical protein